MNDTDLIDELREGMQARAGDTEVPSGFIDRARRTARRRRARNAAAAGTPMLAAAGVATVLATGGSGGSSSHAGHGRDVIVHPSQTQDTAYIIKRMKAKAADDTGASVFRSYNEPDATETANGSLLNITDQPSGEYVYDTSDGRQYLRSTNYDADGTLKGAFFWKVAPTQDGTWTLEKTTIDPSTRTYSVMQRPSGPDAAKGADLPSGRSGIAQALQAGDVTQLGTTTVDGSQVIALRIDRIHMNGHVTPTTSLGQSITLYVDAQTYEPLSTIVAFPEKGSQDLHGLYIDEYLPTTQANIAKATDESIPDGYTKADHSG